MAAVSPGEEPRGGGGTPRWWWALLAAAIALCAIYTAIPPASVGLRTVVYTSGEIAATAAILAGVRRYRPEASRVWYVLAAALGIWLIADLVWGVYQLADRDPFPSLADVFYLTGYPVFATGLVMATRRRAPWLDQRTVFDAALITVAGGYLAWVFLVHPVLSDRAYEGGVELVTVAYPVADVLLLAAAARFTVGVHWDIPALRLLVVCLVLTLVGDTIYALSPDAAGDLRVADSLLLAGVLSLGLAGVHPTMTALTRRQDALYEAHAAVLLVVVAGAGLLVPAVISVQELRGEPLHLVAAMVTTSLAAGLLVARFGYVAFRAGRATERERVLGRYVAELLAADPDADLYRIAERAASQLVPGGHAVSAAPGSAPPPESLALPVAVRGDVRAELVVTGDRSERARAHRALETVTTELALALERKELLAAEQEAVRKLSEQNEQLRELDRMKDQFVSSVSHELRSPLTSIVGYLELLLDGEVGELDDEQRRFLDVVDRNCERLSRLVDDILFVARVDAGRLSLDLQQVDLAALATATVESVGPVARKKGVELRLDAEPRMPPLVADPTRITQLLDNLVSNAVKFTGAAGTVTVAISKQEEFAHLEVGDTGVGIPAGELDRLFDRFFRASTAAFAPGTGLGVSIVKSIVDAHRGKISVESEVGVGTKFLVDLPLKAPDLAATEAAADKEPLRERLRAG